MVDYAPWEQLEDFMAIALKEQLLELNLQPARDQVLVTMAYFLDYLLIKRKVQDVHFFPVCNEANNPAEIIDSNYLVLDVHIFHEHRDRFIRCRGILTSLSEVRFEYS